VYKTWGSFERCAGIANAERRDALKDLRTCLFFERQRWQHYGDEPDAEAIAYWRWLVDEIRGRAHGLAINTVLHLATSHRRGGI